MHRRRLRREDLEDCLSQATLELVRRARHGEPFASNTHISRALEQRFISRIQDRRRAIEGRSAAAATFEHALAEEHFGGGEEQVADRRAEVEGIVERRMELEHVQRLLDELTPDQRRVIVSQAFLEIGCAEFCAQTGWTAEKYRKVAQRARARLRARR